MDKIREKPDQTPKLTEAESKLAQERDKQVKILVPNSTAGMIIGKAGAYIKQIKEESGSYVQISQKPKDITLQERCITIIGDKENNKKACKMILAKIMEDPSSGSCLNVSYADVSGPVANFNPTGSPYAANQTAISSSTASLTSAVSTQSLFANGNAVTLSLSLGPSNTTNAAVLTQIVEYVKVISLLLCAMVRRRVPLTRSSVFIVDRNAWLWLHGATNQWSRFCCRYDCKIRLIRCWFVAHEWYTFTFSANGWRFTAWTDRTECR